MALNLPPARRDRRLSRLPCQHSALARPQRRRQRRHIFQVDLAYRAQRRGLVVKEVPIEFVEREVGDSKMDQKIVTEALWQVTVGFRDRARRFSRWRGERRRHRTGERW